MQELHGYMTSIKQGIDRYKVAMVECNVELIEMIEMCVVCRNFDSKGDKVLINALRHSMGLQM